MIITPLLIIFLVIVFVLLFLFIRTIDKRKWLTFLITLILTPVAYFFLLYPLISGITNYHHQKKFDSENWKSKPGLRYEMIDYTLEEKLLIGKSKTEVEKLLGKAEWLSWDDNLKAHDQDKWNYGLGIEPKIFNEKRDCIEFTFSNDKLTSYNKFKEILEFNEKSEK